MGATDQEGCNDTLPTFPGGWHTETHSASVPSHREFCPRVASSTETPTCRSIEQEEPEVIKRIMVLGPTGAGKSTFVNMIAGSAFDVSNSLASCTQQFAVTHKFQFENSDTWVELIDTPGFNDSVRSEIEVLEEIARGLKSLSASMQPLHGIIYLHKISDYRMSGSARRNFQTFLNMCGEWAMPHVMILTNRWDLVEPYVGEAREKELGAGPELFKPAMDQGARLFRNNRLPESAKEAVRALITNGSVELALQLELSRDTPLLKTRAGAEIDREMAQKSAEHEAEIQKLNEEYKAAQQQRDTEAQEEIKHEREYRMRRLRELQSVANRLREQVQQQAISTASAYSNHSGGMLSHERVNDVFEPSPVAKLGKFCANINIGIPERIRRTFPSQLGIKAPHQAPERTPNKRTAGQAEEYPMDWSPSPAPRS